VYSHEILRRLRATRAYVLTHEHEDAAEFDRGQPYEIVRKRLRVESDTRWLHLLPTYADQIRHTVALARQHGVDLIHCTEPLPSGLSGYLASRLLRIPFILQSHDEPLGPPLRMQPALRRLLYRRADRVVAACNYTRERLVEEGVHPDKIWRILPAVDRARFHPEESASTNAALTDSDDVSKEFGLSDRPIILTTGRIEPGKGHDRVLRVMPQLLERIPQLMYVIAGKGSSEIELRELSNGLGLNDRVVFTGVVSDAQLTALYRRAQVFALLHHPVNGFNQEGFSLVALEASACGTPVVGSRHGGTADSIHQGVNGCRVDPDQEDEIITTFLGILEQPDVMARLSRGALEVASAYDWQTSADQLERLCQELVADRKRKGS